MAVTAFAISYLAVRLKLGFSLKGWKRIIFYAILTTMPMLILEHGIIMNVLAKGILEFASFLAMAIVLLKGLKLLDEREKSLIKKIVPSILKPLLRLIF
jgi:hypothetical protein